MFSVISIAWEILFKIGKERLRLLLASHFRFYWFCSTGFLNGAKTAVTLIFDSFVFDIAVTSDKYQIMPTPILLTEYGLFNRVDPGVLTHSNLMCVLAVGLMKNRTNRQYY